nr:hypothetical protein [Tanacetum cinerariifolium]
RRRCHADRAHRRGGSLRGDPGPVPGRPATGPGSRRTPGPGDCQARLARPQPAAGGRRPRRLSLAQPRTALRLSQRVLRPAPRRVRQRARGR